MSRKSSMVDALVKVKSFVRFHSMLDGVKGLVVAVSGGADSIALLDVLIRLLSEEAQASSVQALNRPVGESPIASHPNQTIKLYVAHLDHMLRGRESEEDARFVTAVGESYGLPVILGSADAGKLAASAGRGIEEVGRELRYTFLLKTAQIVNADRIVTGHTMDDQAETFLMRLTRGAGPSGLGAMRPVMDAHFFPEWVEYADPEIGISERRQESLPDETGARKRRQSAVTDVGETGAEAGTSSLPEAYRKRAGSGRSTAVNQAWPLLIRPLLCLSRSDVEAYCAKHGVKFRTDSSNLSQCYTRNRIRSEVIPALKSINPRAVEAISRAAEALAFEGDALETLARSALGKARAGTAREAEGWSGLDPQAYLVESLKSEQPAVLRRMLYLAMKDAGADMSQVTASHLLAVESLLEDGRSGRRVTLPGKFPVRSDVWRQFGRLVIKARTTLPAEYQYDIGGVSTDATTGLFTFSLLREQPRANLEAIVEQCRRERRQSGRDWMMVALDERTLPERLVIRPRRAGETAWVLGQSRKKKLKNLMIDNRIPVSHRMLWPVTATADGRYVWSPGLPPSIHFAATDESQSLAILQVCMSQD
jgi:tRNA(Ile)-lysidine synthetase-like protein